MRGNVWIWLPGDQAPRMAGKLHADGGACSFSYCDSYLDLPRAIAISGEELPLVAGRQSPLAEATVFGALRDAAPDHWGRRLLEVSGFSLEGPPALAEMTALTAVGSDRIGGLSVVSDGTEGSAATEVDPVDVAAILWRFAGGETLSPDEASRVLPHLGVGGARPKFIGEINGRKSIVKIASPRDPHAILRGEALALRLARKAGLDVARATITNIGSVEALVVERFDRVRAGSHWQRRLIQSGLTLQGLREEEARYASYADLGAALARRAASEGDAAQMQEEIFGRMVFNILIGNTDDHARNHAAFWDGKHLALTPAYDLDPRPRLGREANQAMAVHAGSRQSRLALAIEGCGQFGLDVDRASDLVCGMIEAIHAHFAAAAEETGLGHEDQELLAGRAILNPYVFEGAPPVIARLERPLLETCLFRSKVRPILLRGPLWDPYPA